MAVNFTFIVTNCSSLLNHDSFQKKMRIFLSTGPEYWGRLNPDWGLCNKGRRQSPINVDPTKLLFDPFLPAVDINKETVGN